MCNFFNKNAKNYPFFHIFYAINGQFFGQLVISGVGI